MKESIHELFNRLDKIEDEEVRAKEMIANAGNVRFFDVLHYALSPNITWLLPEGDPPYRQNGDHVNSHPNFWNDVRRLYMFIEGGKNLEDARRQTLFIQMLEFIHPEDAKLLLDMVGKRWPYKNISKEFVDKVFPGLLNMYVNSEGVRYFRG